MARGTTFCNDERDDEPKSVGEILAQLLAQYEAKFPGVNVVVVETTAIFDLPKQDGLYFLCLRSNIAFASSCSVAKTKLGVLWGAINLEPTYMMQSK